MTKNEALQLIDNHRDTMTDPVAMLRWTYLRVVILKLPEETWNVAVDNAEETLSR